MRPSTASTQLVWMRADHMRTRTVDGIASAPPYGTRPGVELDTWVGPAEASADCVM